MQSASRNMLQYYWGTRPKVKSRRWYGFSLFTVHENYAGEFVFLFEKRELLTWACWRMTDGKQGELLIMECRVMLSVIADDRSLKK